MNLYDAKTHEQVALPHLREDFRGEEWLVASISHNAVPGKSGKVVAVRGSGSGDERTLYPQVFGCYIADAPRETNAEENGHGPA